MKTVILHPSKSLTAIFAFVIFILTLSLTTSIGAAGTISLTTLGVPYTQDFNTLANTGTSGTVPTGWDFSESGDNNNLFYNAGTGSSNAGDTYSFGAAGNIERAFGGLQSGNLIPIIGASFANDTGAAITHLTISYTGEQWRLGTTSRIDQIDFQLSTDATSLTTGSWIDYNSLDFIAPTTGPTIGALDGNASANRTLLTFTITGLNIANGTSFWIRWTDFNATGADDGLAVDDFSLTPDTSSVPTNPLGTGTANPDPVMAGDSTLLTVAVTPGANPPSTGLAVTCDLTEIGGSASQTFFDDGSNGDMTLGDNTFTFQATVDGGTSAGSKTLACTISDDQARSGNLAISLNVQATGAVATLVINEVDYDQPGTDAAEFVEIKNTGPDSANLSEYTLELVNGSGGAIYEAFNLPAVTLAANDYFVICGDAANVANCDLDVSPDTNLIQNGAPDAAGLLHNGVLVDAVSYEGNTAAPYTEGSGTGLEDVPDENMSISRCADGADTNQNNVDLVFTSSTPGVTNACGLAGSEVLINEVDSDQVGTDSAEFIELYDGGTGNTDLSSLVLVLYNGSSDLSYAAFDLDGQSTGPDGYFVLCGNAANVANCDLDVTPDTNLIQNGQDAVALYTAEATSFPNDTAVTTDNLVDALVYDTDDADDPGLLVLLNVGQPQVNEGGAGDAIAHSNQRCPNGSGGARNTNTYAQFDPTPGAVNICEIVEPPLSCDDTSAITFIHDIQGSGASSPLVGTIVIIEGVVVSNFQGSNEIGGYHVQEQDTDADADPLTSEGIHVLDNANTPSTGDIVRVQGTVAENFGLTRLQNIVNFANCASDGVVTPATVSLPVTSVDDFEKYEGMAVTIPQSLVISEFFNFDRFGEIVLTTDSLFQPTAQFEPGSPDAAQAMQDFLLNRITLDDGRGNQNPDPAIHPNGNVFDLTNLFRYGDTVANVTGVMDFAFSLYRIQPTQGADYTAANPRPATPDDVGGTLEVASFNVLNYFTTIDAGAFICGPAGNQECRGADDMDEFTRQRDKIIAALSTMNSDVVGLIEIENHPADVPAADLVSGLNAVLGVGTYDYIATGAIGTDAIRVAFIYKPASVSPLGDYAVLDTSVDPRFLDNLNRPVLAQTFQDNTTGGIFTVAVNHLKSKGSDCNDVGDPDTGDGSGNCNLTRKAAAEALVDWLATDPTGSDGEGFLIIGDLNSYDKEDPIDAIKAGPDDTPGTSDDYTDLVFHFQGEDAYSYLFDGQLGYLDHALANAGLVDEITGVTVWHINADEPDLIDYDTTFKLPAQDAIYAPDTYRSSDHDPVIVGLNLNSAPTIVVAPGGICASSGGTMNLTVDDANGDSLTLSATSSNTTAVPNVNIVFGGSGSNRTVSITAVAGSTVRNSTVTITVSDGSASAETTIEVVVGTSGNNSSLMGTSDADLILGLSGNDTLSGLAGNDLLCAGSGNDTLSGGEDDDTLDGASGNDELNGDDGNDVLLGDSGNDKLNGGAGNDTLIGDSGNDDMDGGTGNDVLDGGTGNDKMKGGAGDDSMSGGSGNDELTGGPDADFFSGGQGNDTNTDFNAGEGDTSDGT